jgi:two-component system, sensor histidine kinase
LLFVANNAMTVEPGGPMTSSTRSEIERRRIVIVEDNDDTRELLKELLEMWGHEVEAVGDGVQGAARIIDTRPDVALIDVGLPGIDGFEVAERVCSALGKKTVMLVALSGYGSDDAKQKATASGFDAHLTKPPELEALSALLQRVPPRGH